MQHMKRSISFLRINMTNNTNTNLNILRKVFSVCVPRWKFFSKHDSQVVYKTETRWRRKKQSWIKSRKVDVWSILIGRNKLNYILVRLSSERHQIRQTDILFLIYSIRYIQDWTKQGEFTSCSRRKQRQSQFAGVQDTGREQASAASPAHPWRPEPLWPPSSWGRPGSAVISLLRSLHPHPRCLNHAGEASQAGAAWCLDPAWNTQKWIP